MSVPAHRVSPAMTLQTLLRDMVDAPALEIAGIATDSRRLRQDYVFLACAGATSHGLQFVEQAISAGVVAIVYDPQTVDEVVDSPAVPLIALPGLQQHIGEIANRWFDAPSDALDVVAVTGTNGKTTVAMLVARCLRMLGHRTGYIGTLGKGVEEPDISGGLTSPACIDMHESLAEFRDQNASFAAVEVSSHALAQARTDGVRFDTAIFTNLSRDHLDYHGDMQSYFDAKAQLFTGHVLNHRIINIDDEYGQRLADRCDSNVLIVSTHNEREPDDRPFVFVRSVAAIEQGSEIRVETSWGDAEFSIRLPGDFNVENAALVLAYLLRHGISLADAASVLGRVTAPPGRMQQVDVHGDVALPSVFVDFAHTPAGLEKALQAVRRHSTGELWCVFGCGGDRDRGKRAPMGEVAARLADRVVVTSDNPRNENPAAIINDILAGMTDEATVIDDRAAAIGYAVLSCDESATVVIAGKGHESFQLVGNESLPFSDFDVAAANLLARTEPGVAR